MIEFYQNYLDNMAQTPKEKYVGLVQENINTFWEDNTQIKNIKEEHYPFDNEYDDLEVMVSTVSDVTINYTKVIGDYISILFKDVDHKQNYRGQKYIFEDETYLCYDKLNKINITPSTKCIRCNNQLTFMYNGKIHVEPIFLGYEVTSTNNQISKEGTISNERLIVLVQSNEFTNSIVRNQRFIFQHNQCMKIEQINNFIQESGTNGEVTLLKFHMVFSTINKEKDNLELNLADFYDIKIEDNLPSETTSEIITTAIPKSIKRGDHVDIYCNVYENGVKTSDRVDCVIDGDNIQGSYRIDDLSTLDDNIYRITNLTANGKGLISFNSDFLVKVENIEFSKFLL